MFSKIILTRAIIVRAASFNTYFKQFFHSGCSLKDSIHIRMPSLSPTMTQGNIIKWHKKEGDNVSPGDLLCEIQTDKAVLGLEVEEQGTLAKILMGDNSSNVTVGTLIALMAEEGVDWKSIKIPQNLDLLSLSMTASDSLRLPEIKVQESKRPATLGPAAKILLEQYKIKAAEIKPTGPRGILLKGDILKYVNAKGLKPAQVVETSREIVTKPSEEVSKFSLSAVQKPSSVKTAVKDAYLDRKIDPSKKNSVNKMSIPHSYSTVDVSLESVQRCCEDFQRNKTDVSFMDILLKAVAVSLKDFPQLNAISDGQSLQILDEVNVSFSTLAGNTSASPVVKDPASLTVENISTKVKDLMARANSNQLMDHEIQGSSFEIYYVDNVDITSFQSIITEPHVSCLSVVAPRFVLDENCSKKLFSTISLSVDSRFISDTDASDFLDSLKQKLEKPSLLISQHVNKVDLAKLFAK